MSNLCVDYLNMPSFRQDTPDLATFVLEGYYGFMDYAVAYWVRHVEEAVSVAEEGDAMIKDLAESLTGLLDLHFTAPMKHLPVSQGNKERLQVFESLTRFNDLGQAILWARKELTFFGETRESERALDLGHVVKNIRSELERAMDGAENGPKKKADDLEAMYGPKPFKCSRFSCRYFYDGFRTAQQREQHHDKHLLPFRCTAVGCSRPSIGMASVRELEKHVKETHMAPGDDDFASLDKAIGHEGTAVLAKSQGKKAADSIGLKRIRKAITVSELLCHSSE